MQVRLVTDIDLLIIRPFRRDGDVNVRKDATMQ